MSVGIPESHRDLVEAAGTAVLTTVGTDGRPQSTAVWYLLDGETVKGSVTTNRQKYRNLLANPVATLFVLDPANPYRTLEIRADVEIVPDPAKAMLPRFGDKYGVDPSTLDPPDSTRVTLLYHPRRVVVVG